MKPCQLQESIGYQQTTGITSLRASIDFAAHKDASLGVQDVDLIGMCKLMKEYAGEGESREKQRVGIERKG